MTHRVIVIVSHEDAGSYRQLDRHLSAAKSAGLLTLHSTMDFADDVALVRAIEDADIVLVLLTPALVSSLLWTGVALQQARAVADRDGIAVVPVVVERCDWQQSWLGQRAALPRNHLPIRDQAGGATGGWVEVAAGLRHLFTARAPRTRQVSAAQEKQPDDSTSVVETDLAAAQRAYRLLERYHGALLRAVDAAARATERILGPLQRSSWAPGELHHPGRRSRASMEASPEHIPLKHVSYIWASTPFLQTGGGRVIVLHDGDGALDASTGGAREPRPSFRSTLSVFACFVAHQRQESIPFPAWEEADTLIASARGYSPNHWGDGEVHAADTGDISIRFGGFSEDSGRVLTSPSLEAWLNRIRTLVSGVKGV